MIAFVVAVADEERYARIAGPALERVREADSPILTIPTDGPPQPALNRALDELAGAPDLEAVVIVHEDVRLLDVDTAAIVRATFRDPEVAIAGAIGAIDVASLAWWDAVPVFGSVRTPHHPDGEVKGHTQAIVVDVLDGVVLCLSPWATRTLRFDEALARDFHGYDTDLCFRARYHGRRVKVIELAVEHEHRPLFDSADAWARNELRFQRQWIDHRMISERHHQMLQAPRSDG